MFSSDFVLVSFGWLLGLLLCVSNRIVPFVTWASCGLWCIFPEKLKSRGVHG